MPKFVVISLALRLRQYAMPKRVAYRRKKRAKGRPTKRRPNFFFYNILATRFGVAEGKLRQIRAFAIISMKSLLDMQSPNLHFINLFYLQAQGVMSAHTQRHSCVVVTVNCSCAPSLFCLFVLIYCHQKQ